MNRKNVRKFPDLIFSFGRVSDPKHHHFFFRFISLFLSLSLLSLSTPTSERDQGYDSSWGSRR